MKMKQLNFNYRAVDGILFFLRSTEPSPNLQPLTSNLHFRMHSADSTATMLTKDQFIQGLEPLKCSICLDDYSGE
jgi:hypothetical protein